MIVGIDATPLVGQRTGIGRYVAELCRAVADLDHPPEQVLTLFSRPRPLGIELPPHSRRAPRTIPARILQPLWRTIRFPPVEALSGALDVFHGGNYVVPPTRRAASVMTLHDLTITFYPQTVSAATTRVLADLPQRAAAMDAVITPTQAVAEEVMAEYGLPAERLVPIHHGVDPGWFEPGALSPQRRLELGVPQRYLLFVGTLEPRKNLTTLVSAHARARAEQPDLPDLVLIGARGWGEQHPNTPGVTALGYVPDDDLVALVAGAVAVCSPSIYEGFGLPVLEAMAAGAPTLASDIAAHREIAGGHARFVDPTDVDGWAQALVDVCAQPPDEANLRAARAHTSRFTWQASARAHRAVYDAVRRG